jgi:hypothetical protein
MSTVKKFTHPDTRILSHCVGSIVEITPEGQAMVDFPGNIYGLQQARSTLTFEDTNAIQSLPASVLLVFENDDPALPIISGVIKETIFQSHTEQEAQFQTNTTSVGKMPNHVLIDGKKLTFDAKEEIILQCGKSSINLKQNGKVIIKGANLISRSSGANKIKGGSVNIN